MAVIPAKRAYAAREPGPMSHRSSLTADGSRVSGAPSPGMTVELMPKMPHAGEHHRDAVLIGGLDHLVVAHRAAGLDHRRGARLDGHKQPVGKREEGIGRDHRAFGQWCR